MHLFNGVISISGVSYLIFSIMAIVALGYLLGRVTVKGISLGTAGVFVISLLYGAFFYNNLADALKTAEIAQHGLKIIENLNDDDDVQTDAAVKNEDEEIVDYSNYQPTETKEEDVEADEKDDLVDEDKLYK